MEHLKIPLGDVHPPFNWVWADAAARLAQATTADDVGCVGLQEDNGTLWRLTSGVGSPSYAWVQIGSATSYLHVQNVASDTWVVNHQLGKYPAVTIMDSSGGEVIAHIVHNSTDQLTITASAAFSGKASCT